MVLQRKIRITAGNLSTEAELSESETARALWEALPITGAANVWGEEIYFQVPVDAPLEDSAREEMEVGESPTGRLAAHSASFSAERLRAWTTRLARPAP